jgi:hypothetical protein
MEFGASSIGFYDYNDLWKLVILRQRISRRFNIESKVDLSIKFLLFKRIRI